MSGFNTKEKNNYGEYEIAFYTDNHEDFKKVQDLCRELIDHDKPVSTEGDLISRSEAEKLGATCLARRNENGQLEAIISLDHVPTVVERPQGTWKHIIDEYNDVECPFCGFQEDGIYSNFCPKCGADMRGDAE